MIGTHYTLELYDSNHQIHSSHERYETAYLVTVNPNCSELYYHGTCGAVAKTRSLRTISADSPPKVMQDLNLVCWKTLESTLPGYDPKKESTYELLERTLSSDEKALLTPKLRAMLKDNISDTWKRCGIYKEGMGEFSQALLQRNFALSTLRSRIPFAWDKTTFPKGPFSVTSRIWVSPKLILLATKVAGLISHIDSNRTVLLSLPEHSSRNPPTMQISRSYETQQKYLEDSGNEDLDPILDLLLRIIATSYSRYYWTR